MPGLSQCSCLLDALPGVKNSELLPPFPRPQLPPPRPHPPPGPIHTHNFNTFAVKQNAVDVRAQHGTETGGSVVKKKSEKRVG